LAFKAVRTVEWNTQIAWHGVIWAERQPFVLRQVTCCDEKAVTGGTQMLLSWDISYWEIDMSNTQSFPVP